MEEKENSTRLIKSPSFSIQANLQKNQILTDITIKLTNKDVISTPKIHQKLSKCNKTTLIIKTLNFMSPLQELYSLALRKAFCKIKDNVKSERVSIMYLTPLFQRIMCLKTHYEKKALFFSFSQMKFFCLKSFCSKNERIRKKNISIQKLTSFLEISIRVSLEYAFKIVKQDTNVKNNIKLKQFIVRNMVNIIKKEKNTILKRFFFDILSFSKNKPLKNVKIHRFSQILIHLRNSKQQFGFSKIHNACIKEKNRKLFHQQIILLAFKTIWKKKKEIFSVMNRNLKYDNLIEINNFNKIKRNHDLSLMRKFALKTLTLCYEHLNRKLKEFAFKRIFILTNAIKKQKTSQNIEININTLKFRLTLEIIQKITLRRISNAFQCLKKSFKNLKTLQFEKVSGFSNILDSKLKLIKYMVFNILNSNRTKEISYKKLAIFKILTLSRNKSNIITTAFEKWRSKSKLFKEKIERIHIKTKQTIFSALRNISLSKHYFKKFNPNDLNKKYLFKLLSILNRKVYSFAFLKIYGFKRVAIALHYYAKDINRIPTSRHKEDVKEILVSQNQSYSQGIISTLCKNKSNQSLHTATSTNISTISINSSRKKN